MDIFDPSDCGEADPVRIAVSSCLLGNEVRYDGGHKHNRYVTDTLGQYFSFVSFCPEVAIGLGTPRSPIQLVQVDGAVRVRGVRDPEKDVTDDLIAYGKTVSGMLGEVSGYIFKSRSPSCGMERVKIYGPSGHSADSGPGMFAKTMMERLPELPVEEEGRLMDPRLRENFIERVFVYHRWQQYCQAGLSPSSLVDFHTRHKFLIQVHDEPGFRELGRLVGTAGSAGLDAVAYAYVTRLMQTLKKIATPGMHANVLMHIMGFLKGSLGAGDKAELLELIDAHRRERVPLIVPLTLLKHFLRLYPNDYICQQFYLNPHPAELMLRNHI